LIAELKNQGLDLTPNDEFVIDLLAYAEIASYAVDFQAGPLGGAARFFIDHVSKRIKSTPNADILKERITQYLERHQINIVAIIDDIDRLQNQEILEVFRLVRAVGDISRISYLICYDQKQSNQALISAGFKDCNYYLEKIFNLNLDIPIVVREEYDAILSAELADIYADNGWDPGVPTSLRMAEVIDHIVSHIDEPREIFRLLDNFKILKLMVGEEVDECDLLLFSYARHRLPEHIELMRRSVDYYVIDPLNHLLRYEQKNRNKSASQIIEERHKDARRFDEFMDLYRFAFVNSRTDTTEAIVERRIHLRTPLLSALRLGAMPQRRSVPEMRHALLGNGRREFLRDVLRARISDELDHVFSTIVASDGFDHAPCWRDTFGALGDLEAELKGDAQYLGGAVDLVEGYLTRDRKLSASRLEGIIEDSMFDCVTLASKIIRRNVFAHGLFDRKQSGTDPSLERISTSNLAIKLVAKLIDDDRLTEKLPTLSSSTVFWLIGDVRGYGAGGSWSALSNLLDDTDRFLAFSTLLVGPGYTVERRSIEALVEPRQLLEALEALEAQGEFTDVIKACIEGWREVFPK